MLHNGLASPPCLGLGCGTLAGKMLAEVISDSSPAFSSVGAPQVSPRGGAGGWRGWEGGGRDADRNGQKEGVCTALGREMPSQREEEPRGATPWTTGGLAEPGAQERAKVPRSPLSPVPPPPTPGCTKAGNGCGGSSEPLWKAQRNPGSLLQVRSN